MKVTADNYDDLKAFWITLESWLHPEFLTLSEDLSPFKTLERFEAKSRAIGRQSLQLGIGDLLEDTACFSREDVQGIDSRLVEVGLPTLTSVRLTFWKRIRSIMDRGRIRSATEYYALRNVVEEMEADEQSKGWDLLGKFELAVAGKAKRKVQ